MSDGDTLGEGWRSEILDGLSQIDHNGSIPGTMVVWGEKARAILNSAGPGQHILIAAAELGQGRVAAMAHEGLLTSSVELKIRIENWLNRGEQRERKEINRNTKKRDIIPGQLLIWKGANLTGDVSTDDVIQHVLNGGSLLHSMCPWGWLQLHNGKSLSEMPLAGVLHAAGFCYTESYGSIPKDGLVINNHRSNEKSHVLFSLRKILSDPARYLDDDDHSDDEPVLELSSLPHDLCSRALGPELKQLSMALGCRHDDDHDSSQSLISKIHPCHEKPLEARRQRTMVDIVDSLAKLEMASLRGVDSFLGRFSHSIEKVCEKVVVESKLEDIHPTGSYLPRGGTLVLKVLGPVVSGWRVRIGAHSDNLSGVQAPLRRWPKLVVQAPISGKETTLFSPYGGLVYLHSPKEASRLEVCLDNVVKAPFYNLCDPESISDWTTRRNEPGLWADMMGEHVIITLPASSVRNITDPGGVLRCWDSVVRTHHDLRGTDPTKHRKQWIVTDEQPCYGYMHAGYPIVTHMDVSECNNKHFLMCEDILIRSGNWGMYHELGHNMQRSSWTFSGTVEVTCNIFTLHAMEKVSRQPIWIHEWLSNQLKQVQPYLSGSKDFSDWKDDPGLALFIYAQIAHHFGWDVYKKVFRQYEEDAKNLDHAADQAKIDTWFIRISRACGYNLAPLFTFWKIPLGSEVETELSGLKPYLPKDEVTAIDNDYAGKIRAQYKDFC